jgi:serine/threonine-protein kinase
MEALGTGSMGTVYKARSKTDNQWYAVKVLPRRSLWNVGVARRKVRMFQECQHSTVVPLVDVGTSGGAHYLGWRFIEGETLDKIVAREGRLSAHFAAVVTLQVAEALEVCHERGLFHGRLKPSNVMLCPAESDSAELPVFLLDFGIGTLLSESASECFVDTMSTANAISNALDCTSPESIVDPNCMSGPSDQYSLGCVLYYCLAGRYPFTEETTAAKITAVQLKQPTPVGQLAPDLPQSLSGVVERLMQKAPAGRYANTAEVVAALRALVDTIPPASKVVVRPTTRLDAALSASFARDDALAPHGQSSLSQSDGRTHGRSPAEPSGHELLPTVLQSSSERLLVRTPSTPPDHVEELDEVRSPLFAVGLFVAALAACLFGWLFIS